MPTYRYYCLDRYGRIHNAEWFDAASDAEALAMIQALHPDASCEVWKGRTMVGATSPRTQAQRQA